MKKLSCVFLFTLIFFTSYAKPVTPVVPIYEDLSSLGTVSLSFLYDNIEVDTKKLDTGKVEITEKNFGQSDIKLIIFESFFYQLETSCKSNLIRDNSKATYKIKIHPAFFTYESFFFSICTVSIYDKDSNRIAFFNISSSTLTGSDKIESFSQSFSSRVIAELKKMVK